MGFRQSLSSSILLIGTVVSQFAYAWPPTFGAEFTFTNDVVMGAQTEGHFVNNTESEKARDLMGKILKERCRTSGGCNVSVIKNQYGLKMYRVTYEDGWWFQVATDPSVVEVQTKAATYEEIMSFQERFSQDIFGTAHEAGLSPRERWGGGHIHIGMTSALDGDAKLLRNFSADYANHSELASGVFADSRNNAPPIQSLSEPQRENFVKLLNDFDAGKIRAVKSFSKRLQKDVYYETPSGWYPAEKYQAMNVTRMAGNDFPEEEQTFEIRAFEAQQSAEDFFLETHLLEKRLERLKSAKHPVQFMNAKYTRTSEVSAARFYQYVTETGLDWDLYSKWLKDPALRASAPNLQCDISLLP
jgi:hypothetical protein